MGMAAGRTTTKPGTPGHHISFSIPPSRALHHRLKHPARQTNVSLMSIWAVYATRPTYDLRRGDSFSHRELHSSPGNHHPRNRAPNWGYGFLYPRSLVKEQMLIAGFCSTLLLTSHDLYIQQSTTLRAASDNISTGFLI